MEIAIIAIGLSQDVLAYALYKGAMVSEINKGKIAKLCAIFTIWQMAALLAGNLITKVLIVDELYYKASDTWKALSAVIFLGIGCGMIVKSSKKEVIEERKEDQFYYKQIIIWACITSIDAFFAGIGLGFLNADLLDMVMMTGISTVLMVIGGIYAGYRLGCSKKNKATTIGGCFILIAGVDVLIRCLG